MSTGFCSVCGAVLRDGVCPNGHPQRAARRARTRRRRRWPWVLLLLFLLVAVAAYGVLQWYPRRASGDLMRTSSREYADALASYTAAVEALPAGVDDPQVVIDGANQVLARAGAARTEISTAQLALEDRAPPSLPIVFSRPPLDVAIEVRDRMLRFYTSSQTAVSDLEAVAGYLTELSDALPQLEDLEEALGGGGDVIEAATPVSNQLAGDLEALTPPEELGSLQASLQAITEQIRTNLEQAAQSGGQASAPILRALIGDIHDQVDAFREAIAGAPAQALDVSLGKELRKVANLVERIRDDLVDLRDHGVADITVPSAPPPEPPATG